MPVSINKQIADAMVGHTIDLMRIEPTSRQKVLTLLYQLGAELKDRIDNFGDGSAEKLKRLEGWLGKVGDTINTAYGRVNDTMGQELLEVGDIAQHGLVDVLNTSLGAQVAGVPFTRKDLEVAASDVLIKGAPSADWWAKQSDDTMQRFATEMRMGFLAGESVPDLVKRVVGTPTGNQLTLNFDGVEKEVKEYAGGVMETSKREATALVRTSVQAMANKVHEDTYKENADVIKGMQWLSTLDGRTTPQCFTGSTRVVPVGALQRVYKRRYSGKFLIITTATGQKLEVTPNHPILTARGWLPANEVQPNQEVVYTLAGGGFCSGCEQKIGMPAMLSELAEAFADPSVGVVSSAASFADDFHGDGQAGNGDVNIASVHSSLMANFITLFRQKFGYNFLGGADVWAGALLAGQRGSLEHVNVGFPTVQAPKSDLVSFQEGEQPIPASSQLLHNLSGSDTRVKEGECSPLVSNRVRLRSSLSGWSESELGERVSNSGDSNIELLCQCCGRVPVTITASKVVEVRSEFRTCHVFNLQTSQGLYWAGGLLVKNCRALDGTCWDLDGNPLPDSPTQLAYPGPPPIHWNCRSTIIPITKSWNELIAEAGGQQVAEAIPEETRASMDGQVAGDLTYEDWLGTKPEEFQQEVLGPARYDLWKSGKASLADMVDQSANPLTVNEIRQSLGLKPVPLSGPQPPEPQVVATGDKGGEPTVAQQTQQEELKKQLEEQAQLLADAEEKLKQLTQVHVAAPGVMPPVADIPDLLNASLEADAWVVQDTDMAAHWLIQTAPDAVKAGEEPAKKTLLEKFGTKIKQWWGNIWERVQDGLAEAQANSIGAVGDIGSLVQKKKAAYMKAYYEAKKAKKLVTAEATKAIETAGKLEVTAAKLETVTAQGVAKDEEIAQLNLSAKEKKALYMKKYNAAKKAKMEADQLVMNADAKVAKATNEKEAAVAAAEAQKAVAAEKIAAQQAELAKQVAEKQIADEVAATKLAEAKATLDAEKAKAAEALQQAAVQAKVETQKAVEEAVTQTVTGNPPQFPADPTKLKVIKALGGASGANARLVEDELGRQWVLKSGISQERLREEATAESIYRIIGVPVPDSKLYETAEGPMKLSRYVPGSVGSDLSASGKLALESQVRGGFAADALLGNWDAMGSEFDNVLLGEDKVAYRVDVGGSLRYRAMGTVKSADEWNQYPSELFTIRSNRWNPKIEANMNRIMGKLSQQDVVAQVDALLTKRAQILAAAPDDLKEVLSARMDYMEKFAKTSKNLLTDKFKDEYVADFTYQQLGINKSGLVDLMPDQLSGPKNSPHSLTLVDEKGQPWDSLRGNKDLIKQYYKYVDDNGGNSGFIKGWGAKQAGSSDSSYSQAVRYWISQTQESDDYYWVDTKGRAKNYFNELKDSNLEKSMTMQHAFTYELLTNVKMDTVDQERALIRLIRTEDKSVVKEYGIKKGAGNIYKHAPVESASAFNRTVVHSSGETMFFDDVPIQRVYGFYGQGRPSDPLFLSDSENEVVVNLQGLKADYRSKSFEWTPAYGKVVPAEKVITEEVSMPAVSSVTAKPYAEKLQLATQTADLNEAKGYLGDKGVKFSTLKGEPGSIENFNSYKSLGGKAKTHQDWLGSYFKQQDGYFVAAKQGQYGTAPTITPIKVAAPVGSTAKLDAMKGMTSLNEVVSAAGDKLTGDQWFEVNKALQASTADTPAYKIYNSAHTIYKEKGGTLKFGEFMDAYLQDGSGDKKVLKPFVAEPGTPMIALKVDWSPATVAQINKTMEIATNEEDKLTLDQWKKVASQYTNEDPMHGFASYKLAGGSLPTFDDFNAVYMESGVIPVPKPVMPNIPAPAPLPASPITTGQYSKLVQSAENNINIAGAKKALGDKLAPSELPGFTKEQLSTMPAFTKYQEQGGVLKTYTDYLKAYFNTTTDGNQSLKLNSYQMKKLKKMAA